MYGIVINDEYFFIKMIGRGVYSKVWLAFKVSTHDWVAVKMIEDADRYIAMKELGINLQLLKDPTLGVLIDHFRYEGHTCMVLPLLGGTVYDLFKKIKCSDKILEKIFKVVVSKLRLLHSKYEVIHGDIKPENIAFKHTNPFVNEFIERFEQFCDKHRGFLTIVEKEGSVGAACSCIFKNIFQDDDRNSENFVIYNSSNDESVSSDNKTSTGSETDGSGDRNTLSSVGSAETTTQSETEDSDSISVDDESSHISSVSLSSVSSEGLAEYNLTEDEILRLELHLIDFSHTHTPEEDLDYVPTRYYRCLETLEGKEAGYYKDWYALACTMYELENGDVFADPKTEDKDTEQIKFIQENLHKIDKWLVKE